MTRAAPERKRKPKAPQPSEQQVESSIRNSFFLYGIICPPNRNEARSAAVGRSIKIKGTISGFPDLTVISSDGRVGFMEVKTPIAKPRNAKDVLHWQRQAETQAMLSRMGHDVAVVRSQDDAVLMLQEWGWNVR
jgi:hypothetical protein